ncbi:MAG: flavin monoamine oxidase family protein [Acidimicrobiales bacterium]
MSGAAEADVCVIGAGFAGLTAALRLSQAGREVIVLEARDRVGGRTWTEERHGRLVDRGGAWLAPRHGAAFRLAGEMGASTYKTYVAGSHVLVREDGIQKYKGLIPKISPRAVIDIALAQLKIDRMARRVPLEEPWAARRAADWDAVSVGDYLDGLRIHSDIGRELYATAVRGLFAAPDMHDVSMLDLLFLVKAHGSIEKLFSIKGGSQENMVEGGLGAMAQKVAVALGGRVHLSAPVRSVTHSGDRVVVEADGLSVSARHVVVSVPPALALEIAFDPVLPEDRAALYRAAVAGSESKVNVVYDEPFWRGEGFSGQSAGPNSPCEVTLDSSPADASYGVIASFTFSANAQRLDALDEKERRDVIVKTLAERFGPKALEPADVVDTAWWHEPWSRGCSMAHFPCGVLTRYGPLLRQPFGRLHWAGTETSTMSHGAVDGAIRSGERAAREIVEASATTSTSVAL